jgi:anti-sigma B factor antagonist
MKVQRQNGTLSISGLRELSAASARLFHNEINAAILPGLENIEIDLSEVGFVDGVGLGALVSLYKTASDRGKTEAITVRLLHPQPPVQQLLELTRMHRLFEIVPQNGHDSHVNHLDKSTQPR